MSIATTKSSGFKVAHNHTGRIVGCFTVISKAESLRTQGGSSVKAQWNIRCVCGHVQTKSVAWLGKGTRVYCESPECTQRSTAPADVICADCGRPFVVQRRAMLANPTPRCRSCVGTAGCTIRGLPAHNRLPDNDGAVRNLMGRYLKNARDRGIEFDLSLSEFRDLTQRDCFYCGAPPSQMMSHHKSRASPLIYNGVDRVSSELGYVAGNVEACCGPCNYMKSDSDIDEFIARCVAIAKRFEQRKAATKNRVFHP